MALHVLILAGGSGARLWPLSRRALPKHLLPLGGGGRSLLRATAERVCGLGAPIHVVTGAPQAERCRLELAGLAGGDMTVIAEPVARGTGPALGLAVAAVARSDPDAIVCSVHADHQVTDPDAYLAAVWAAAGWAGSTGGLATVGVRPSHPATGFGYIGLGEPCAPEGWRSPGEPATSPDATGGRAGGGDGGGRSLDAVAMGLPAHRATGFHEKPSRDVAERFVAGGGHLWNLGLFAWPAATFLSELRAAAPEVAGTVEAVADLQARGDEPAAVAAYSSLGTSAVEPLVLERRGRLTVVEARLTWSDVGSWSDLYEARRGSGDADADGNVVEGEALLEGCRGSLVVSRSGRCVTLLDCDGLVVVDTGDALLVADAGSSQRVRRIVERLEDSGRGDLL